MWIPRTQEEVGKWNDAATREARFQGFLFGGLAWAGVAAILAGGWSASAKWVAVQDGASGSFWFRLPIFLILGLTVAVWLFRREKRNHFERASQMTICPKCDTAAEGNAGASCECGGEFVLQRNVRWADEETQASV